MQESLTSLPFRGENRRQTVEGFFCGIFYLMYQVSQKYPSVKPTACQLSTRHALRVPFQGILFLKKRQPNKKSISHRITPVQRCSFPSKSDLLCCCVLFSTLQPDVCQIYGFIQIRSVGLKTLEKTFLWMKLA